MELHDRSKTHHQVKRLFMHNHLVALVAGVCLGPSVIFLALGPAVAMLYVRRCTDVRLTSESTLPPAAQKRRVLAWSILAGVVVVMFSVLFLVQ